MRQRFQCALRVAAAIAILGLATSGPHARDLTWYEWVSIAPIVVAGQPIEEEGRHVLFRVDQTFRGDLASGTEVLVDVREMNRSRNRDLYRKAKKLEDEAPYMVLLEPSGRRDGEHVIYEIVRGTQGARALPAEGQGAIRAAVVEFVAIQDRKSESHKWRALTAMLDADNPIALQNALEQFLKFRRGDPDVSLSVVPLLDHPLDPVRARAAALVGQIVETFGAEKLPEEQTLRGELFALARRDPVVEVRLAACRALSGFEDKGVEEVLQEVADKDPEQDVRYEAEKLLYERRIEGERGGRG